jgi:hypothetical protein
MIWPVLSLFTHSRVLTVEFCCKVQTVVSLVVTKTRFNTLHPRHLTGKKLCSLKVNNHKVLAMLNPHSQFTLNLRRQILKVNTEFKGCRLTLRWLQGRSKILKMWQKFKSLTWVEKQLRNQTRSWAISNVEASSLKKVSSALQQNRMNNNQTKK